VAGQAVVQVDPAADRGGTHPGHKTDPAVLAGPCIPPVPNPEELPAPVDGLVSAPHGPDSAHAQVSARLGLVPAVQVA
jgi:hypothetical protein